MILARRNSLRLNVLHRRCHLVEIQVKVRRHFDLQAVRFRRVSQKQDPPVTAIFDNDNDNN